MFKNQATQQQVNELHQQLSRPRPKLLAAYIQAMFRNGLPYGWGK